MPSVGAHLTAIYYVDNAISYSVDEIPMLRSDPEEKIQLDEQDSLILISTLTSPNAIVELPRKSYVT